jgi:hypothetical protein
MKLMNHRKAQYEAKFREWGFRKNLTKEQKEALLHKKYERDEAGKESVITGPSSVISQKRIRRLEYGFAMSELKKIKYSELNTSHVSIPEVIKSSLT